MLGANWNKIVDAVLGGLGTGYILYNHSGFPITLQATGTAGGQNDRAALRPNRYLPGLTYVGQSIDRWFGTADTICLTAGVNDGKCVYGVPDAASFGNSGKATERAPSLFSLDLNLSKRFHITEAKYVLLRSDFYNLPNHPAFAPRRATSRLRARSERSPGRASARARSSWHGSFTSNQMDYPGLVSIARSAIDQ